MEIACEAICRMQEGELLKYSFYAALVLHAVCDTTNVVPLKGCLPKRSLLQIRQKNDKDLQKLRNDKSLHTIDVLSFGCGSKQQAKENAGSDSSKWLKWSVPHL